MNKKVAVIILVLWIALASDAQIKKGYTIHGKVPGLNSGKVYLSEFVINGKRDSTIIKNGIFSFRGSVAEPTPIIISLEKNYVNKPLLLFFTDNNAVFINLDKNDIEKSQVKGSAVTSDYELYKKITKQFDIQARQLSIRSRGLPKDSTAKPIQDSIQNAMKVVSAQRKDVVKSFVKTHPSSAVSAWATSRIFLFDPGDMAVLEELHKDLSPSLYTTSYGKLIKEKLDKIKNLAVGLSAPDFTQNDTAGNPVSLKDFRGKYILLDFWASWCGPCRVENPNVVAAYNKYNGRNFTVLSVSLDRAGAKDAWLTAIHKDGLAWTHVSDLKFWDNEVGKLYGVNSVPANFLIDPSGKIIAKDLHDEKLQETLEEILK